MRDGFVYNGLPIRVIFGDGTLARLPEEVERLDRKRVLILSTAQQRDQAERLAELLGKRAAGVHPAAVMHTPVAVTEKALARVTAEGIDGVVSLGGGSAIGLGKAIAVRTGLPHLAVPTTYAGSEMTPILGETDNGIKTTRRSGAILPTVALYDVALTHGLPAAFSVTSGMNAIAHAVEALYAQDRNPIVSIMAEQAIAALVRALPGVVADPADPAARTDALYGAWLGGTCLGSVGMALHHKLCHVLGGAFDLPHAETHTVLLPHAVAYNAEAAPDMAGRLAAVLNDGSRVEPQPGGALQSFARRLGAPTALRALGMPEAGIDHAADLAVQSPYWNPRPVERNAIRTLLARAWAGDAPITP
ncbi:maleylacetate reductase [Azospirillum sp. A29]|jgi:alcohol dehydrogenase class IV|uniref:maleylacetate reductase n=1 Tax=Azospirillum sp. A29 TaxID=3160606 RepID=UPI00366F6665